MVFDAWGRRGRTGYVPSTWTVAAGALQGSAIHRLRRDGCRLSGRRRGPQDLRWRSRPCEASSAQNSMAMERFRREVALTRRVSHPNVCRVYELYETTVDGHPLHFLSMEFSAQE